MTTILDKERERLAALYKSAKNTEDLSSEEPGLLKRTLRSLKTNKDGVLAKTDPTDVLTFYQRECKQFPPLDTPRQLYLAKKMHEAKGRLYRLMALPEDTIVFPEAFALDKDWATYEDCHDTLFHSCLTFVVEKAIEHAGRGVAIPDLIQEGNIALLKAMETFDYEKGARIEKYAARPVNYAMVDIIDSQSQSVSTPSNALTFFKEIDVANQELWQNMGREPTAAEIARVIKRKPATVANLIQLYQGVVSLNESVSEEEETNRIEFILGSEEDVETQVRKRISRERVRSYLKDRLTSRDLWLTDRAFGLSTGGKADSKEGIGIKMKISGARVGQIMAEILSKLGNIGDDQELRAILEDITS